MDATTATPGLTDDETQVLKAVVEAGMIVLPDESCRKVCRTLLAAKLLRPVLLLENNRMIVGYEATAAGKKQNAKRTPSTKKGGPQVNEKLVTAPPDS